MTDGAVRPLLLCSGSPRRADLLRAAGIAFERGPAPDVDETPPAGVPAPDVALALARAKAARAAARAPERVVLCADTTVVLGDAILGKPADPAEARARLRALSGRAHLVVTGVAVAARGVVLAERDVASVTFRALDEAEIGAYVATGEPFDKAGGYGVQGGAAAFVTRVEGDLETVVGLPTRLVRRLLAALDGAPLRGPSRRPDASTDR